MRIHARDEADHYEIPCFFIEVVVEAVLSAKSWFAFFSEWHAFCSVLLWISSGCRDGDDNKHTSWELLVVIWVNISSR